MDSYGASWNPGLHRFIPKKKHYSRAILNPIYSTHHNKIKKTNDLIIFPFERSMILLQSQKMLKCASLQALRPLLNRYMFESADIKYIITTTSEKMKNSICIWTQIPIVIILERAVSDGLYNGPPFYLDLTTTLESP